MSSQPRLVFAAGLTFLVALSTAVGQEKAAAPQGRGAALPQNALLRISKPQLRHEGPV